MKKNFSALILGLVFFLGLSIVIYPTFADYWNQKTQSKAIVDYEAMLQKLTPKDYSELFEAAEEYNQKLAKVESPFVNFEEVEGYKDLLNIMGNGLMGYISIEKIGVELPVYHGTSNIVLNSSVGHLEGSSLPVGGEGTHTVLSAHRGLPRAKLFTDLDKMEVGDVFVLNILDRTLTYQVDNIQIVEPDEVEPLYPEEGKEYCSLVTCTPYGINTHRLIVRGIRIENAESKTMQFVPNDAYRIDVLLVSLVIAIPILFVLFVILMVKYSKKPKKIPAQQRNGGKRR